MITDNPIEVLHNSEDSEDNNGCFESLIIIVLIIILILISI